MFSSITIPLESDYEIIIEEYDIPTIQNMDEKHVVHDYVLVGSAQTIQ